MHENRKTYLEDLEAWMWITKGVRFYAHERLLAMSKWSNISLGMMSAYLIIINLVSLYFPKIEALNSPNLVGFITTALSILILVFGQLENSNDFKMKAEKFHDCSREIAKLHRQIRELKRKSLTEADLEKELDKLTIEYQLILDKYDNHKQVEYKYYKSKHPKDFVTTDLFKVKAHIGYYISTYFIYHVLIISPLFLLFIPGLIW